MDAAPEAPQDLEVRDAREAVALDGMMTDFGLEGKTRSRRWECGGFFERYFSYSSWQERPMLMDKRETALTRFLLRTRKGHCEYLRRRRCCCWELGIPARYTVGYSVTRPRAKNTWWQRDAHAWCLVWNEDKRYGKTFDTTPRLISAEEKQKSRWNFYPIGGRPLFPGLETGGGGKRICESTFCGG